MQAWHCVLAKPQQETRAAIELAKQDFEVFLPILDSKPMFPRYLFVAFDRDRDNWGAIKSTRGCIDLLRNGFSPALVPASIIQTLKDYRPAPKPVQGEVEFTQGQKVRIATGPLQGLEGLFVADKRSRVMALLEIMGRRIEIPQDSIQAA